MQCKLKMKKRNKGKSNSPWKQNNWIRDIRENSEKREIGNNALLKVDTAF